MTLIHYSSRILRQVLDLGQDHRADWKPTGLWLSVQGDMDWPEFVQGNMSSSRKARLHRAHRITLNPAYPILIIDNGGTFDHFTQAFRKNYLNLGDDFSDRMDGIDWTAVAWAYAGIIIAPYLWERRMEVMWYYGWDCASGCIWNADAILDIERIT